MDGWGVLLVSCPSPVVSRTQGLCASFRVESKSEPVEEVVSL
jgi:hypothetical protein